MFFYKCYYNQHIKINMQSKLLCRAGISSERRRRPAARIFFAALTSRSWTVPQSPVESTAVGGSAQPNPGISITNEILPISAVRPAGIHGGCRLLRVQQ